MIAVVAAALAGAALGSFANVCALRWPKDESVLAPRSRCPCCGRGLGWRELVPVVGWIALRGRCKGCRLPISLQYPLMEAATGLLWAGVVAVHGPSLEALRGALFLTILIAIAASDARFYIIPDQLSLGGAGLGGLFALLPGGIAPLDSLAGAATGFCALWLVGWASTGILRRYAPGRLARAGSQSALGGGDIKMMLMVGAFVGPAGMAVALLFGSALALVVFGPLSLRNGPLIPFGVFLGLGGAVAYTWGGAMVEWYLTRFL